MLQIRVLLGLLDGDGARFAYFDAAFTTETFFGIDGNGFAVLHLKYFHRAHIDTFLAALAFIFIDDRIKSHSARLLSSGILLGSII
jgi:hypothetical protein